MGSTDQAYSSGFYFRIAWKSMEQTSVLWHFSLSFLRGLGSTNIKKVITSKKVRGIFWIIEIRVMLVVKCFGWRMQKYFSLLITNDWVWPHSVVDIAFAWFQSTSVVISLKLMLHVISFFSTHLILFQVVNTDFFDNHSGN